MQKSIFIVDDNDTNLTTAKLALKDEYRLLTMASAGKMFELLEKAVIPDLILLDIEMPDIDGFEALNRLKNSEKYSDIPVIFLTNMSDPSIEVRGFQMGVIDFITKPFSAPVLQNRIKSHLDIDSLIRERTEQLQKKNEQLKNLQNCTVFVMADMVESRDKETGGHIERTTHYIKVLIDAMLEKNIYSNELRKTDMDLFISSARLHDVGKIAIPDHILNKPAKLTEEEFEIMKTHAEEGEKIIDKIITRTEDAEFMLNAKLFAGYHHERWDGKGYPRGLKELEIPLQGRIMAIVDVYDALVSERPYKKAFSADEACKIILDGSGSLFDPAIIQVFDEIKEQFRTIHH